MNRFVKRRFSKLHDDGRQRIANLEFESCTFDNCGPGARRDATRISRVTQTTFHNTIVSASSVGPMVIEDVTVENLKTLNLLILWGTLFTRTRFVGNCGTLKLNLFVHHVRQEAATQSPFDRLREAHYASIDWALDLREAKFRLFDIQGIPSRLILRDPATQFVVTRERASDPSWRQRISKDNERYPWIIDTFLAGGDEDLTLIAPMGLTRKPQRDKALNELLELRKLGVAT